MTAAIPDADLSGHVILVTGANSGIGLEAARILAGRGARMVLACRSRDKGDQAAHDIAGTHPSASLEVLELDLADLADVEHAAEAFQRRHHRLDVLCNNAGVMALPYRATVDGFEMQMGTNHLGHFALTGHLVGPLLAAPAPRVVTVSSLAHRIGTVDFDNLDATRGYDRWRAYAASKLANLLFTFELQRRAEAAGAHLLAVAAHPGYAATNLQSAGPRMAGNPVAERLAAVVTRVVGQDAAQAALPTVVAAVGAGIRGCDFIGPGGPGQVRGRPVKVRAAKAAQDPRTAARLWDVSERLTGVRYDLSPDRSSERRR